jgi:DNA-directed RNA polymerase subunit RPC12/RpoP
MKKIKDKIRRWFTGRYGIDDLGKLLLWVSIIFYVAGQLLGSMLCVSLSSVTAIMFCYRFLSRQIYERSEENLKYTRYVKSWKLKYQYRKTAKIYMCPQCGKMIRVPKGKGKIQITCPNCSHSIVRYT